MASLLALLVLLVSASIAALLAWGSTRTFTALAAFLGSVAASGVVLALALTHSGSATISNVQRAKAEPVEPGAAREAPAPDPNPAIIPDAGPPLPQATDPERFVVEAASAEGFLGRPTSFTIGDEGELYIGHDEGITIARDTTGDGVYDSRDHFGLSGGWVFGLALHEGSVYAAVAGSAMRLTDQNGDGLADEIVTLTTGLPHNLYGGHSNNGIRVGPDGLLYMTVGGSSDHGPELEPLGGTILTIPLEGGQPTIYARGFRNPYDLEFCPDGTLYATDNGPDQLGETLPHVPWDELNLIVEGGDYGYPDYFDVVPEETGTISPVARVAPAAGITGLTCYAGDAYPAEFQGNFFITLWGTFTYPIESGRRVMRVEFIETEAGQVGHVTEFANGFGNPINILQDPDGHLLVLDHGLGQIFRIRYIGD